MKMGSIFESVLVASLTILFLHTKATQAYRVETEKHAVDYLTQFGYVNPQEMPAGYSLKDCNKKLMEFQKLSRVDVTGIFDNATMKAMNSPRCGCPDFINFSFKDNSYDGDWKHNHTQGYFHNHGHGHNHKHSHGYYGERDTTLNRKGNSSGKRRSRRYALTERKWDNKVVTYSVVKYPSRYDIKLTTREIEDTIQKAFQIWEQHINLKFRYQPNSVDVDIEISFVSTYHGDDYPFDGPGKVLGHAYYPGSGIGGDVHFDQEENWSLGKHNGIDLLFVTVHEVGHALGLGHSTVYKSIMYPMYGGYIPNLQLHEDDIRGIQAIYGRPVTAPRPTTTTSRPRTTSTTTTTKRVTTPPRSRPTTPRVGNRDLCIDPYIDSITTMFGETILVFKGTKVYEIAKNGSGILSGWPKEISSFFSGLEGDLDCVLTRSNGKTYFFKGQRYWRFTGQRMDRGYPRSISEYFPGIPNDLDAAFEWNEEFVFVKEDNFWRFNTRRRPQVDTFYPMPISHWGLSDAINAAFTAPDERVYFFQNTHFWEFDKTSHKIVRNNQASSIASEKWFGCWEP